MSEQEFNPSPIVNKSVDEYIIFNENKSDFHLVKLLSDQKENLSQAVQKFVSDRSHIEINHLDVVFNHTTANEEIIVKVKLNFNSKHNLNFSCFSIFKRKESSEDDHIWKFEFDDVDKK